MATLFKRLWAYHKITGEVVLPKEHRQQLGKIVKKEFFSKWKLPVLKMNQTEEGEKLRVLDYHPAFTPRLDKLILNYYRKLKRETATLAEQNA